MKLIEYDAQEAQMTKPLIAFEAGTTPKKLAAASEQVREVGKAVADHGHIRALNVTLDTSEEGHPKALAVIVSDDREELARYTATLKSYGWE